MAIFDENFLWSSGILVRRLVSSLAVNLALVANAPRACYRTLVFDTPEVAPVARPVFGVAAQRWSCLVASMH
jgi:hypothetical protein